MENKPYSIQDLFENREKVRQVVNSIAKDVKDVTDNLSKQASKLEVKDDPVDHPSHYTYGKIEVIDYIEDKNLDFLLGNVVKYVSRAGHKDDMLQDLKKAAWYLNRKIKQLETK